MPIAGLDVLRSRICRKNNPSLRASQAFLYNCANQYSFQYDRNTLKPCLVASTPSDATELCQSTVSFSTDAVKELSNGKDEVSKSSFSIIRQILMGSFVIVSHDPSARHCHDYFKQLSKLSGLANDTVFQDIFDSSVAMDKPGNLLLSVNKLVEQFLKSSYEELSSTLLSAMFKSALFYTLNCMEGQLKKPQINVESIDSYSDNLLSSIDLIFQYETFLDSELVKCSDKSKEKFITYEMTNTIGSFAILSHLLYQLSVITNKLNCCKIKDVTVKKCMISKFVSSMVVRLKQSQDEGSVNFVVEPHVLSVVWAFHKVYGETNVSLFLQHSLILSAAWIHSVTKTSKEDSMKRCRYPFVAKILKDVYVNLDKTTAAKFWFMILEQLSGDWSVFFNLWSIYIEQWKSAIHVNDENAAPLQPISSTSNRFTLSRAVLAHSKMVTTVNEKIDFMFQELQTFASTGQLSDFAMEMKTILKLLSDLVAKSDKKDLFEMLIALKNAEIALACFPKDVGKYLNFDSTETKENSFNLLKAQCCFLKFLNVWYQRQTPKPEEKLLTLKGKVEVLKPYIADPSILNPVPNCSCFDHPIASPELIKEYEQTKDWMSNLHTCANLLLLIENLEFPEIQDNFLCESLRKDAINTLYNCSCMLLLMSEPVRALVCCLKLEAWLTVEKHVNDVTWKSRLERLFLQIRIYFLENGLETEQKEISESLNNHSDTLSLRTRLFCATTTCSSSNELVESSSAMVECPSHRVPMAKCMASCRWLLSSPLYTSYCASTLALVEAFKCYDRHNVFTMTKFQTFGDHILKFADLLHAIYFASDVASVAGVYRDASRAAYEGLRLSLRFASPNWTLIFQLQMLETLKFQDKIQHASHYKLLMETVCPDTLISTLARSKEVDDMILSSKLSFKFKVWTQFYNFLTDVEEDDAMKTTASWLKNQLSPLKTEISKKINENQIIKASSCSLSAPMADSYFAAWIHFFDFATRFPGNDLESMKIQTGASVFEKVVTGLQGFDLSKVFEPRKPSYEALALGSSQQSSRQLKPKPTNSSSNDELSFQVARYFPSASVYSEICRLRANSAFKSGASSMVTAYWLHEANGVCFRHMLRASLAVERVSQGREKNEDLMLLKQIRTMTRFPPVYDDFVEAVKEIPIQWTVIQISVLPSEVAKKHKVAICQWKARCRRDQPNVEVFDGDVLVEFLEQFEHFMSENEDSLKLKERKEYWRCRMDIDKRMEHLMNEADKFIRKHVIPSELLKNVPGSGDSEIEGDKPVVVLMLDAWTTPFTWEVVPTLKNFSVVRSLTLPFLTYQLRTSLKSIPGCELVGQNQLVKWPIESFSYVLDPDNNLAKTRATFEPILTSRHPSWLGHVGKFPSSKELLENLRKTEMFVFIGHGTGLQMTSYRDLGEDRFLQNISSSNNSMVESSKVETHRKSAAIGVLMGCSSLRLVDSRRKDFNKSAALIFPLASSPAVFGNLFNVTDVDIDRFLMAFLDDCLTSCWRAGFKGNKEHPAPVLPSQSEFLSKAPLKNLLSSLTEARSRCKLRFLNGSAPVCYGLPLAITRDCVTYDNT